VTDINTGDQLPEDQLPQDLDVTAYVGPYLFPDITRRRLAGACHGAVALAALIGGIATGNAGLVGAGALLGAIAVYHVVTAWHLAVDQTEALGAASRAAGFAVGHASAQLGWRGLLSRPSWRILLYSADEPPSRRGLVEIDAVDGAVLGQYVEDNPEDWSEFGLDQ
jgi:hypothetical protein